MKSLNLHHYTELSIIHTPIFEFSTQLAKQLFDLLRCVVHRPLSGVGKIPPQVMVSDDSVR